jgi:hypothetical protein
MSVASSSRNGTGARAVERGTWWLIEAATATLRETDRVARFGPGRLHVLLPETRGRQAERVVERIRERWAERAGIAGTSEVVLRTAVAPVPTTGGIDDAFRRAEATTTPISPGTASTTRSSGSEVAETAPEHPGTPESTPSSAPDPTA